MVEMKNPNKCSLIILFIFLCFFVSCSQEEPQEIEDNICFVSIDSYTVPIIDSTYTKASTRANFQKYNTGLYLAAADSPDQPYKTGWFNFRTHWSWGNN